jgi:hypothetical protein
MVRPRAGSGRIKRGGIRTIEAIAAEAELK